MPCGWHVKPCRLNFLLSTAHCGSFIEKDSRIDSLSAHLAKNSAAMMSARSLRACRRYGLRTRRQCKERGRPQPPNGCFLHLCLELGQLLWQEQCHQWTATRKAWMSESRVLSCVRFYMQGQRVGDAPVFDGMCANCGHLLYGPVNRNTASTGNKFTGAPQNIQGSPCSSHGQPPFLLCWPLQ